MQYPDHIHSISGAHPYHILVTPLPYPGHTSVLVWSTLLPGMFWPKLAASLPLLRYTPSPHVVHAIMATHVISAQCFVGHVLYLLNYFVIWTNVETLFTKRVLVLCLYIQIVYVQIVECEYMLWPGYIKKQDTVNFIITSVFVLLFLKNNCLSHSSSWLWNKSKLS